MTQTNDFMPTVVVAAVGTGDIGQQPPSKGSQLAATVAAAIGVDHSTVHVDDVAADSSEQTPEEALAAAIAEQLPADAVLVVESEHADRWRSRHSVAEHTIDAFSGPSLAIGPHAGPDLPAGPAIVALDGSPSAEGSLPTAIGLAQKLERTIELVQIVPDPLHPESGGDQSDEADHYLREVADRIGQANPVEVTTSVAASNDPVTALVSIAAERGASLLVLASRGDRATSRSSMSRTAAGLIAEAGCPVLVVGVHDR